jgi:hypothetical protein
MHQARDTKLCGSIGGSADEMLQQLFGAANAFTAGAPQHDDMTVVVARGLCIASFFIPQHSQTFQTYLHRDSNNLHALHPPSLSRDSNLNSAVPLPAGRHLINAGLPPASAGGSLKIDFHRIQPR